MKNYTAGWAKAIAETNARIQVDEKTLNGPTTLKPANEHSKAVENYGWDKAIDAVNARIAGGVAATTAPVAPAPEPGEKPESVTQEATHPTEADQRVALVENFCGTLTGRPMGIAHRYRNDARPMSIIMQEILSRNLQCRAGFWS